MSKSYDVAQLPALPEGWHYERHAYDPDVLHVVWPDHGVESIHFRLRIIESGWNIPYRNSGFRYAGKGWKTHIVRSAIALLQRNWV